MVRPRSAPISPAQRSGPAPTTQGPGHHFSLGTVSPGPDEAAAEPSGSPWPTPRVGVTLLSASWIQKQAEETPVGGWDTWALPLWGEVQQKQLCQQSRVSTRKIKPRTFSIQRTSYDSHVAWSDLRTSGCSGKWLGKLVWKINHLSLHVHEHPFIWRGWDRTVLQPGHWDPFPSRCSQLQAQMQWALSERGGRLSVWQWVQRASRLLLGLWRCLCGAKYGLEQSMLIVFHSVLFYCIVLIGKRSVLVFTLIYRRPPGHAGKRFWALLRHILTWGGRKPVVLSFRLLECLAWNPSTSFSNYILIFFLMKRHAF